MVVISVNPSINHRDAVITELKAGPIFNLCLAKHTIVTVNVYM